jgi:hypothetical protein
MTRKKKKIPPQLRRRRDVPLELMDVEELDAETKNGSRCCARTVVHRPYGEKGEAICTRTKGHSGDHVAAGFGGSYPLTARWTREMDDIKTQLKSSKKVSLTPQLNCKHCGHVLSLFLFLALLLTLSLPAAGRADDLEDLPACQDVECDYASHPEAP